MGAFQRRSRGAGRKELTNNNSRGTTATMSVRTGIIFVLAGLTLALNYPGVFEVNRMPVWLSMDIHTSNTNSDGSHTPSTATMVRYLDPEVVQEAKRIQDDFCKSLAAAPPPTTTTEQQQYIVKNVPAGSVHALQTEFNIHLHPTNDVVSNKIMRNGAWESETTRMIIDNISIYAREKETSLSDLTFVDIGANIGWYTMTIASLGVNVVAFEPMAQNLELLRRDLCLAPPKIRDRITLVGYGLSDKEQTCFQYVHRANRGNGMTKCVEQDKDLNFDALTHEVVGKSPLRILDNVIRTVSKSQLPKGSAALTIAALKIDTEGFEPIVFRGGDTLLSQGKIPIIFAEFAPYRLIDVGGLESGFEYLENFFNNGYGMFSYFENGYGSPATFMPNITVALAFKWFRESDIVVVHESFRPMSTPSRNAKLPRNFVAKA